MKKQKMEPKRSLRSWIEHNNDAFDAYMFDIDGVFTFKGEKAKGSRRLLKALKNQHKPFYLLTNDGNHSAEEKAQFLRSKGIGIKADELVSCGHGLIRLVKEIKLEGALFFIMGDLGTPCFAKAAGLKTTRNKKKLDKCRGVIVGESNYDWEPTINAVINSFIDDPKKLLVCPNPDEYFPGKQLKIMLGAGSVARLIQRSLALYGIRISPVYLGKPYPLIFKHAHALLEKKAGQPILPSRVLMVGDNLESDIKGACEFGYRSALMLTGLTHTALLHNHNVQPDLVFEAL